MTDSYPGPPDAVPPPAAGQKRGLNVGLLVGLLVPVLVLATCATCFFKFGTTSHPNVDRGPSKYEAKTMCEKFVEPVLKAPASARYSGEIAVESGGIWVVTGAVDSQNSFGAMLRSRFECRMTVSGDTWKLTQPVTVV